MDLHETNILVSVIITVSDITVSEQLMSDNFIYLSDTEFKYNFYVENYKYSDNEFLMPCIFDIILK